MELFGIPEHNPAARRIREASSRGTLSHALLLTGGGDRLALARYAAAAMECTHDGARPCGVCRACGKVLRDVHPDVTTVRDEEHKTIAADVVRAVRSDAWVQPNEGRRKVYIFPDCALLTERDQNILLKVVEEGPPYAAFLFCAENGAAVLQTLRSRCVEIRLRADPGDGEAVRPESGKPGSFSTGPSGNETSGFAPGRGKRAVRSARDAGTAASGERAAGGKVSGKDVSGKAGAPSFDPAVAGEELCRSVVRGRGAVMEWAAGLERKKIPREELSAMLHWCRGAFAAALLSLYGRAAEGEYAEMGAFLAKNLTKSQLAFTIETTGTYAAECGWNIGAGHILGALAAELEGVR